MNKIKIFLIAGEASGDLLGYKLIVALKKYIAENSDYQNKQLEIIGIGGAKMEEEGLKSAFSISELSLIGFAEIIPHIPKLLKRIKQTAKAIIDEKPDVVITIDAPDFCFRVIKKVNQSEEGRKIKKTHFIAPTVWAYRPGRAEKIAKLYDLLLVILPFEPPYFEKYGLKTVFIGHPILEKNLEEISIDFRTKYNISKNDILLCLTPGSRTSEVRRIFPEMIGAVNILAKKYPNLIITILATEKTYGLIKNDLDKFQTRVILTFEKEKISAFKAANLALAKSGTNTLEIAFYKLPMIVVYKANYLTYLIIKILSKVKFANLINIISNREIIPEMIQNNCRSDKLAAKLEELMANPQLQKRQIEDSVMAMKMFEINDQTKTSSQKAAAAILNLIKN